MSLGIQLNTSGNVTPQRNNTTADELPAYEREDERIKTFEQWPHDWLNRRLLAQTGMIYTGNADRVKCVFCGCEINAWNSNDHPVLEHLRWSPNCPLLRRRTTSNVPLDAADLDSILPPLSNDIVELRPHSIAEDAIRSSWRGSDCLQNHIDYAIEAVRLSSFRNWPLCMKQTPEQLAEAGFFYTGTGDHVVCFSCGQGLKDWEKDDDPWTEHATWFSQCPYLRLVKGQEFIDGVLGKLQATKAADVVPLKSVDSSLEVPSLAAVQLPMQDETSTNESKLCKICYEGEYNTAFLPCGHVVACAKCALSVTKCPMCRKPFTDVMRVYLT